MKPNPSTTSRPFAGLVGSLFVSACCLGGGPILAAAAAAMGFSAFHNVLNIYVLGPLMTLSVAWIVRNLLIQGRALMGRASRYWPFWFGAVGGGIAWVGVILPHVIHGTRPLGTGLIVFGMAVMIIGSFWSLMDQNRNRRHASSI